MKSTKIIMISGKKTAGKDHVTKYLLSKIEKNARRYSFADSMKRITSKVLNIPYDKIEMLKNNNNITLALLHHGETEDLDVTIRKYLQTLGQTIKDEFGYKIWAEKVSNDIKYDEHTEIAIISDFRFELEWDEIISVFDDVITVRVLGGIDNDSHESEKDLDNFKFDYYIDNESKQPLEDNNIIKEILEQCK